MRVKQLAEVTGVTGDTARYYTRIGFFKPNKELPTATRNTAQRTSVYCGLS